MTEYAYDFENKIEHRTITEPNKETVQVYQDKNLMQETIVEQIIFPGQTEPVTQTTVKKYDYEKGNYTVTVSVDGSEPFEKVTVYNINSNIPIEQVKVIGGQKYYAKYDENGNTQFAGIVNENNEIQGSTYVAQFLETPKEFCRKMGINYDDFVAANPDVIRKGSFTNYGVELVIPGQFDADKAFQMNEGREPQALVEQRVETNNVLKKECKLADNKGYGQRVGQYTIQGTRKGGRGFKIALDKKGNVVILDKNNNVVPNDRVGYLDWWDTQGKIQTSDGQLVVAIPRDDGHGRFIYYTENAVVNEEGQPIADGVMSGNWGEDNKYIPLADWYVEVSDVRDICIKNSRVGFSESVTQNGKIAYFTDPRTGKTYMFEGNGAGKMLLGKEYDAVLNADVNAIATSLINAADGAGTDEDAMIRCAGQIKNPALYRGVEQKLQQNGYGSTSERNPYEVLSADELNTDDTSRFLAALVPGAPIDEATKMYTHFADWTYDGGFGITTDADQQDLHSVLAAGGIDLRKGVEAQYKASGAVLNPNAGGSFIVSKALDDDFSQTEVSTSLIESNALSSCWQAPAYDETGEVVDADDFEFIQYNINNVHGKDKGTEAVNAEMKYLGQNGMNSPVGQYIIGLAEQTVNQLGLTADFANQEGNYLDIYIADCSRETSESCSTDSGISRTSEMDAERYEYLNRLAYSHPSDGGTIPTHIRANALTYQFLKDKGSSFEADDLPESAFEIITEQDTACREALSKNLTECGYQGGIVDLYNQCQSSDEFSKFQKQSMKAAVMISGDIEFTEQDKMAFLKEFTHTIRSEYEGNGTTLLNGSHVNNGDFALLQFENLVSTLSPQEREELVKYIESHDYTWTTNAGGHGQEACYINHDKKGAFLGIVKNANYIKTESAFDEAKREKGAAQFAKYEEGLTILEHQFGLFRGSEGGVSDFANSCAEVTGFGTDRQDVLNKLYESGFRMDELKAAFDGRLYGSDGKLITPEAYLEKYDVKIEVAEKIEDYKFSQACWKNAPVIITVAGVTIVVGVAAEVFTGGAATPVVMGVVGAVSSGTTQYLMDYYEMSSSGQGTTAHGRSDAAKNAFVTGATAGFGMGVGKYVTKFGNFFTRAGITVATDGAFSSTVTSAVHDFDVKSVGLTLLMSAVFGSFGGPKGNKVKVGDIDVTTSVKPQQGSELFKHFDDFGNCGGKLSAENARLVKEDLALRIKNGMIEPEEVVVWHSAIEALEHSKGNRALARELRAMLEDGTGVYLHKGQLIDIGNTDDATLAAFRKDVAKWADTERRAFVLGQIDEIQAAKNLNGAVDEAGARAYFDGEPEFRLVSDEPVSTPRINETSQRMFDDEFNSSQLKQTTSQNAIGGRIGDSKFKELKAEFEQLSALAKTPEQLEMLEGLAAKFNPQHKATFMEIINARRAKLAIENPNELYLNNHQIVLDRDPMDGFVSRPVNDPAVRAPEGAPVVRSQVDDIAGQVDDVARQLDDAAKQAVDDIDNSINSYPALKSTWTSCKERVNKILTYTGQLTDDITLVFNLAMRDLDLMISTAKDSLKTKLQSIKATIKAKFDALSKQASRKVVDLTDEELLQEYNRCMDSTRFRNADGSAFFPLRDRLAEVESQLSARGLKYKDGALVVVDSHKHLKSLFNRATTIEEMDGLINEVALLPQTNNTKLLLAEMQVKRQQLFAKPADIDPSPEAIRAAQGEASNMWAASDEVINNFYNTLSPAEKAIVDQYKIKHDDIVGIHGILRRKLTTYDTPQIIESRFVTTQASHMPNKPGKLKDLSVELRRSICINTDPIEYSKMSCARAEKKLVIITGRTASGKSTIAKQLGLDEGYYFPDSDDLKAFIPGYKEYGAGYVHETSADLCNAYIADAFKNGLNTVVQTTGWHEYLDDLIINAKAKGYTDIQIVHVNVEPDISVVRSLSRAEQSGRFVDPGFTLGSSYVDGVIKHCVENHQHNLSNIIIYDNNVSPTVVNTISFP